MDRLAQDVRPGDPDWSPVVRTRTYELVLDRIEEQIAAGRLSIGDRLPGERELAASLGVSRSAVREAMRVLEAMGLITQGTGSGKDAGTVVTATPGDALTRLVRVHALLNSVAGRDVVRARIALERESARLAAGHASAADLAEMDEHLAVMDDPATDVAEFNERDTAFHVAVARASGNALVADLTTALRTAMRGTLLTALQQAPDVEPVRRRLCSEHRAIADAVRGGDRLLAADLVERHIADFYVFAADGPDTADTADTVDTAD
ncbi:FadR/GntR family transcriptional regulator [Nocardioides sp. GY 10127]|uniref:FadR/GntR family transcriptional regulator n=1 Tax=Nocardioides sp. GY 10127 TaxID=2569762 RepID=UPI00197D1162|nr:FadR/GntR family transcriptional regulator [Nocardioides sp. GY 10127]